MTPTLSILMPALASRTSTMRPLIEAQVAELGGAVEFIVDEDAGELSSGTKRQRLMDNAAGAYVAFVDDDDEVEPDYVQALLERCDGHVDVVTFDVDQLRGGELFEHWCMGLQEDAGAEGRMAANHLCAWRADLARRVGWCSALGYADDQLWYGPLHASGLPLTEAHIHRTLYRYIWSASGTANQKPPRVRAARQYFGDGIRCYRDAAGEIFLEDGDRESGPLFNRGRLVDVDRRELELFHIARMR